VRVLQEMMTAGLGQRRVAVEVRALLQRWFDLLIDVLARRAGGGLQLGPFRPHEAATLVGLQFMGRGGPCCCWGAVSERVPCEGTRCVVVGDLIWHVETGGKVMRAIEPVQPGVSSSATAPRIGFECLRGSREDHPCCCCRPYAIVHSRI
jgi:hypothetical protein